MPLPLDIRYRQMSPSSALNAEIEAEVRTLEELCPELISCHVVIEQPHQHKQRGNHFRVQLELHVPGQRLVVGGSHDEDPVFEDAHAAVARQFQALRRRLQDVLGKRHDHRDGSRGLHGMAIVEPS